ncbi:putative N-carbamoyl-L-amino acid hydrolase [Mollisia scopiformis]|uniref:Putative N-carbamoyl-L-amino acid hydrolase n=1 Tax=Mollisia scopiformis TaxID=149040 RepID=A0A194XC89_MOLSC|nr:putative N-carbamoyl-L-amino acid hydrolase [Mollisia scopiformis]KUJ17788.1 putative N-carbamoyl-L-amino acid hydrolase [Mollisia scopiformis]
MVVPSLSSEYLTLKINESRINATIHESCEWGNTPDGGMNRLTANDDDKRVRDWFIAKTKEYGCSHKIDAIGNIFAIRPGQNNSLPPIAIGSHLDTQPTGGRYDGILGVVCGVEVLKVLHENNITSYAPVAVVNWTNEEGARFPPCMLGSGVWAEQFTTEYGHTRVDLAGISLGDELKRIGYVGSEAASFRTNPILAHFEVHIEQGPILDKEEKPAGVVRGVQSMKWYNLKITGREAHTGSTPMDRRSDALLGAAKMIVEANRIATTRDLADRGARATIAVINSSPQSINTIAGEVQINLDMRSPFDEDVAEMERQCRENFEKVCEEHGLKLTFETIWTSPAVNFNEVMKQCVRSSALELGCNMELTSGAGHDSVYTSKHVPTAMIFVRCRDGVSHNPAEYTRPEDCAAGAQVLLGAYLRYDNYVRQEYTAKVADVAAEKTAVVSQVEVQA